MNTTILQLVTIYIYIYFKFSISKCYNIQISITRQSLTQHLFIYNSIYVRATCFDLVGHPQSLQEHRFKRCLVFLDSGIPNAYKFQLQEQKVYKLVQIELAV